MPFGRRAGRLKHLKLVCTQIYVIAPWLQPEVVQFDRDQMVRVRYSHAGYFLASNASETWSLLDVVINPFSGVPIMPFPPDALVFLPTSWDGDADRVASNVLAACAEQWTRIMQSPGGSEETKAAAAKQLTLLSERLGL